MKASQAFYAGVFCATTTGLFLGLSALLASLLMAYSWQTGSPLLGGEGEGEGEGEDGATGIRASSQQGVRVRAAESAEMSKNMSAHSSTVGAVSAWSSGAPEHSKIFKTAKPARSSIMGGAGDSDSDSEIDMERQGLLQHTR